MAKLAREGGPEVEAKRCLVIVMAGGQGQRLYPLTKRAAKPAVRFAGAYRIIDFTLSNCLNSGLKRVYVLAQYGSTSLLRHLRRGWARLLADDLGEFLEVLPPQQMFGDQWYAGTADAIFQNLYVLQQERPDIVVLLSGDHAYKMDYRGMIKRHIEAGAKLTIASLAVPIEHGKTLGVMTVDEAGRVIEFNEKPQDPKCVPGRPDECLANMGVYVWDTRALAQEVAADAKADTSHDFGKNIIPSMVARGEAVYTHEFVDPETGKPAYWRDIGTLQSYWATHMDLVSVLPELDMYDQRWPLYTAHSPYPPAKTVLGDQTKVLDCLMCDGCVVSGAVVERSVLSPGVRVGEGARIEESILFDDVVVGPGAKIRRAVIDEGMEIPAGYQIGYDSEADAKRFVVGAGGITVVPAGVVLH